MMALLQTKISAQFGGQFPKVFIKKWFLLLSWSNNLPFLLSTPNSHAWICSIMNSNWLVISGTSSTQGEVEGKLLQVQNICMASPAVNLHDHYSVIYPPIFSRLFTMPVISLGHSNDSPTLFPSRAHFLSCGLINLLTGDLKFHYEHSPGAPLTLSHPP